VTWPLLFSTGRPLRDGFTLDSVRSRIVDC
jgi:hypothetical protein